MAELEGVAGELQCPVCLEFFTRPTILPCSHILCRTPCAERLFNHGFVRCPVCRDNSFVIGGVDTLPRVISLENIIERYRNGGAFPTIPVGEICGPDDIPCQLCQGGPIRKAAKSCLDCNASYCLSCLQVSHPDKEPFSEHQLVEPRRYPKPRELRCSQHDMKVNIFCRDCQTLGCLLCADDKDAHPQHQILSLDQANTLFRNLLEEGVHKLECSQEVLGEAVHSYQDQLSSFQGNVEERRSNINNICNSLIAEVETKREFFMSDLEYEEKSKTEALLQQVKEFQQQASNTLNLQHYVKEVLKEDDPCSFLQLAKSASEKITKIVVKPSELPVASRSCNTLQHKVVDIRKEKAILKDINYLTAPATPGVDMSKCTRSATSVVIVLCPPNNDYEVLDGYKVYYCCDEQKARGEQDIMLFKTPGEERKCGRGPPSGNAVCLIHDNLKVDTTYYFCVRAFNAAGESETSEIVNCKTLSGTDSALPVPEITERMCRTYTYSIQIYSSSPVDIPTNSEVSHYLLYREASVNKIWKSVSMYGRLDHRVFGLDSDTMYDFCVMSCGKNGECQVSNMVTLRSERAAY